MKNIFTLLLAAGLFLALAGNTYAQENHGGALNTFVKFGDDASIAAHYEFQVANNITVSPEARFWFSGENDMALGGRADYYFDSLFGLPEKWDIWAGVDAGFLIGDGDSFTVNAHAGVEYRFTNAIGIIFEFAGGVTSSGGIGVAFHL